MRERENVQVHLTNAAMMKGAKGNHAADQAYDHGGDHERSRLTWTMRPFLEHLVREGKDPDAVLAEVEDAVVKVVLSGQAKQPFAYRRPGTCYDMFGIGEHARLPYKRVAPRWAKFSHRWFGCCVADVMFDADMKPFVLELNLAPQLASRNHVNQVSRAISRAENWSRSCEVLSTSRAGRWCTSGCSTTSSG